jgi:3-methyl-2-oxobutanoate hydroxymethyltransferase
MASIPVCVHLGLRPQAVHLAGGYRAQARDAESAGRLIADAVAVEKAGACLLLLEAVPAEPARIIAESVRVPVIGCGAGPHCDGHVVVLHDMLGLSAGPLPRFVQRYADLRSEIGKAIGRYVADIKSGAYPAADHRYTMGPGEAEKLADAARNRKP